MTDLSNEIPAAQMLELEAAFAAAGDEVRAFLRGAPPIIRPMTSHLAKASGKMIRAKALLACALRKDGRVQEDAARVAGAVELLHLATLVHDDIIDRADKRRGIDALYMKFGEKSAVLCGDYLFCSALDLASKISPPEERKASIDRTLPHYYTEICLGELRQNQNAFNYALPEREYYKIIEGKTAALFEAAFFAGFLFSDESDASRDIYQKLGHTIGVIFQLADDCLDYEFSFKRAKKPVLSDFSRGVITLPLIYALKKEPGLRERLEAGVTPNELKAAVKTAGGLGYTREKIAALVNTASSLTSQLEITAEKKALLDSLIIKASGQ